MTTASDGHDAWKQVQDHAFDVVISDREMPVVGGLELCRRLRRTTPMLLDGPGGPPATEQVRYTYVILVTSHDGWGDALEGIRAGADDYLSKPLSAAQLELRLIVAQRVTDLYRALESQQQGFIDLGNDQRLLARRDSLTGLPNRRALQEDLGRLRARAARHEQGFSAALIDIDHFKSLNDTAGHVEGDRVLKVVAEALAGQVRVTDCLYRFGGEEFVLLLDTADRHGAHTGADRLRKAVRDLRLAHPGRPGEFVTVSAGTAQHDPSRPEPEAVITDADVALYRAKRAGRDRTYWHGDDHAGSAA